MALQSITSVKICTDCYLVANGQTLPYEKTPAPLGTLTGQLENFFPGEQLDYTDEACPACGDKSYGERILATVI